jgi:hypothetical protein
MSRLRDTMDTTDHGGAQTLGGARDRAGAATTAAAGRPGERRFGPEAASLLSTEHWGLLSTRSMLWNEAISRTSVFLTVLSAAIVALALLADAAGFGRQTTAFALVLLPVVLFLGLGTYLRLVQINRDEKRAVLAMNRLRHAYLELEPGLEPYFTSGHHDDEAGFLASYELANPASLRPRAYFLVTTPTIVATIDAAVAATVAVLITQVLGASTTVVVAAGIVAFLALWGALLLLQRQTLDPLRRTTPRFPSPPGGP